MDENTSNEAVLSRLHLNSETSDTYPDDQTNDSFPDVTHERESQYAEPNGCDDATTNDNSNNIMECEAASLSCPVPSASPLPLEKKLKDSEVTKMLKRLSNSSAHFKHQQRNEPDLSSEEKFNIARSVFEKSPALFLSRFKKHLSCQDIICFEQYIGDYEIDFHLKEIITMNRPSYKRNKVKNRRYNALMHMMSVGDEYFSEEAMKSRDPLLYEEMIGQYLTKEERTLKAADIMGEDEFALSNFLMKHVEQIQENNLYYNLKDREEETFEEMDSDTDEEIESENDNPTITKDEKNGFRVEFLQIMQERFLDGKDSDYDYSSIDNNDTYDDLDEEGKDEEEKYFDDEEPEYIHDVNIT